MLLRTLFFLSLALLVAASPLWPFSTAPAGEDDDDSSDNDVDDYVCRRTFANSLTIYCRRALTSFSRDAHLRPRNIRARRKSSRSTCRCTYKIQEETRLTLPRTWAQS